jgi:hypothetical protein
VCAGAAYQYEEETSSDSDDEVLKQFNEVKRTGSVRGSVRSHRSKRSTKSAKSEKTKSGKELN